MYFQTILLIAGIFNVSLAFARDLRPKSLSPAQPLDNELPAPLAARDGDDDNDDKCLSSAVSLVQKIPTPTNKALIPAIESYLSSEGYVGVGDSPRMPKPTVYCEALVAMPDDLRYDYMSWEDRLQSWCTEHTSALRALATKCPIASLGPGQPGPGSGGEDVPDGAWKGGDKRSTGSDHRLHLTAVDCEKMSSFIEGGCEGVAPFTLPPAAAAKRAPAPMPVTAATAAATVVGAVAAI